MVDQVRRFNRRVTERVGALDDHFLARDRSLGESRVLWEIGRVDDGGGCDVRRLRTALGLDSGYLSRLLRSLEADGLVTVEPSADDGRVRTARLTAAGGAERAEVDRRADAHAWSLLAPLTVSQRERLVDAMGQVERLLTAALVEIAPADPGDPDARHCLHEYYADIDRRFDSGFDPARSRRAELDDMRPPDGLFLVARLGDEPVGGGGVLFHGEAPAELKRLWVAPAARGLGIGRRLLAALTAAGPPYFKPPWHPQVVGIVLGPPGGPAGGPDDDELAELITESYCLVAPRRLADQVARPSGPG